MRVMGTLAHLLHWVLRDLPLRHRLGWPLATLVAQVAALVALLRLVVAALLLAVKFWTVLHERVVKLL